MSSSSSSVDSKLDTEVISVDQSLPLAVDIGNAVSHAALYDEDSATVQLIPTSSGTTAIPSYVSFLPAHSGDGIKYRTVAGQESKDQCVSNAKNTVFAWKRFFSKKFSDPAVQRDKPLLPYNLVRGADDDIFVQLSFSDSSGNPLLVSLEEIQAIFLAYIRKCARIHSGLPIQRVVIGVPADFGFIARESVRRSVCAAFLNPARLINEAAAVAVDYSTKEKGSDFNCLIVDVGAAKMDLCLVSIEDGVVEVKGTVGDSYFGGEDFTQRIMAYCSERFYEKQGYDLRGESKALARLRLECEKLKLIESLGPQTVSVAAIVEGINLSVNLPESFLQFLCEKVYYHFLDLVEKIFQKSHILKEEIRQVLICGSAANLPLFRLQLKQFFADVKDVTFPEGIADEAVVRGLAKEAAEMSGHGGAALKDALLIDVTPRQLSVELADGSFLTIVPRCSTIPAAHILHVQRLHRGQKAALIKIYESGGRTGLKRKLLGVCLLELVSVADYKKNTITSAAPSIASTPQHATTSLASKSPHHTTSASPASASSSSTASHASSSATASGSNSISSIPEDSPASVEDVSDPTSILARAAAAVASDVEAARASPPPLLNLEIRIDLTVGDEMTVRVREDHSDKSVTVKLSAESMRIAEALCASAHATYGHHLAVRATPAADA